MISNLNFNAQEIHCKAMLLAQDAFVLAARGKEAEAIPMYEQDDALDTWVDAHFDEEVRFLQELVRVPTHRLTIPSRFEAGEKA